MKSQFKKLLHKSGDTWTNTYLPTYITIGLFVLAGLFLAFRVKYGIPPDEIFHREFIKHYANNSIDPVISSQSDNFFLGDITRTTSYGYHYLFSIYHRFMSLFVENVTIFMLRAPNVLIGAASLYVLRKLGQSLNIKKIATNTAIVIVANVPMFLLLSSSVNYDNLVILLSLMSFYVALRISKKSDQIDNYLALWSLLVLGVLVKFAFLPIAGVLGVYSLHKLFKSRQFVKAELGKLMRSKSTVLLVGTTLILLGLLLERYAVNIVEYGDLQPSCDQVLTREQCLNNGIYRRSEALNETNNIRGSMNLFIYLANWIQIMFTRIYGVLAHKAFRVSGEIIYPMMLFYGVLSVATIRKITKPEMKKYGTIIVSAFVYVGLLIYTNHQTFVNRNMLGLAVQGRYVFPILFPLILIGVHQLYKLLKPKYYSVVTVLTIVLALIAGLPNLFVGFDNWLN